MKDDYTTNAPYLTYTLLFQRLGERTFSTWEWKVMLGLYVPVNFLPPVNSSFTLIYIPLEIQRFFKISLPLLALFFAVKLLVSGFDDERYFRLPLTKCCQNAGVGAEEAILEQLLHGVVIVRDALHALVQYPQTIFDFTLYRHRYRWEKNGSESPVAKNSGTDCRERGRVTTWWNSTNIFRHSRI